jgi:sulfur-carrier protein adenylyltransferase/sulfurtransferase
MNRYNRHIILSEIGQTGQDKLSNAKVLVIGAGGLGCPILQYLAAAGIGTLGVIDFDVVELSNLQRQVLFGTSSLGINKAIAAKERLEDLNDSISIIAYAEKLTHQNAISLFKDYDIIVDGSDNFETRYLVNDAAIITNKPLVFGAIYKFEGQVSVFNFQNGPSYRCLFPSPPEKNAVPNCSEIGVLGVLPGIIGSMQANEVLKIILGIGHVLSGKLLCYNFLKLQNSVLKINRSEKIIQSVLKNKASFHENKIGFNCDIKIEEISIKDVQINDSVQFIDVREAHEQPKIDQLNITYIPLSKLKNNLDKINLDKQKYLFCQSGIRSKQAVSILKDLNITKCFSIKDGASEIIKHIKNNKTHLQMSDKKPKNVFKQGAISSEFIGTSIAKHQTKTSIGAHNIFLGQVRADVIDGKTVSAIEYRAYEDMANQKFDEIREAAFEKFELTCMHIYHSLGTVKSGEICLFVFVSSPRRKVVFKALEYIVEEIKAHVPVFGKEIFEDESHQWKVNN